MKILVTGGAGFIGSHVVDRYINLGHCVHVVDNLSSGNIHNLNPKAKFWQYDILDHESIDNLFANESFDLISHHAAQMNVRYSVDFPQNDAKNNIIGSLNIYEAARKYKVKKIIFASTGGAVYGEQEYFPADEQHPLSPCSPYGIAKLANEKYLIYYKDAYGIDFVILRYSNVYGPRQNSHGEAGVVAIFTEKILRDEQPIINGDGLNTRDYIYIDDLINANELALSDNMNGIFNVSTSIETDVITIFEKLKSIIGADVDEIHSEAKLGEQRRSVCSNAKLFNSFAWTPNINLNDGLALTVDFFKANIA